jgi:DNA-binding NarL/FixJ family response regulator
MADKPVTVAIIEDDASIREGISIYIDSTPGYSCNQVFESCEEALEKIKAPLPDVLLMDISLTGMSGIEGVKRFREKYADAIIIMLTVYEDDKKIFESLRAGASGYLLKRTPLKEIITAINDVLAGGAPMSPAIAKKVLNYFSASESKTEDYKLTPREQDILKQLVFGSSYKMVAKELEISLDTVRSHIKKIYEKLQVHSKSEAVAKALRSKLF